MKSTSYVRVSTEEQKNGDGPERQVDGNVECAAKHVLEIYNTLKDIGYSASKGEHISHGALGKYLEEAEKGLHKGGGTDRRTSGQIKSPWQHRDDSSLLQTDHCWSHYLPS
jgi:DNA invertase Pin-like site-specific DNA recombinase